MRLRIFIAAASAAFSLPALAVNDIAGTQAPFVLMPGGAQFTTYDACHTAAQGGATGVFTCTSATILTVTLNTTVPAWNMVALEGQSYTPPKLVHLRFGTPGNWIARDASGGMVCNAAFFGAPASPTIARQCQTNDQSAAALNTKIMVLGDSVPGYVIEPFWNALASAGYKGVDFVGNLPQKYHPSNATDQDSNAWGGYKAQNFLKAAGTGIEWANSGNAYYGDARDLVNWMAGIAPDVAIIEIGTNDGGYGAPGDPPTELKAYSLILQAIRATNPKVKVVIAQITPATPSALWDANLNAAIPAWAAANSTTTSPVAVVDMFTGYDATTQTVDGTHPNPAMALDMAQRWLKAVTPYLPGLVPPPPLPTAGFALCAAENANCVLPGTTLGMFVIYGAGTDPKTWTTAKHVATTTTCTNAVFGDPDVGVVKACWAKYDMPVAIDMSKGVPIDVSKIPAMPTTATPASPWGNHEVNAKDMRFASPKNSDGTIAPAYAVLPASDGVGAFRVPCYLGVMAPNDPLVFPGAAGASHLHSVAGNMGFDQNLTTANQRSAANLAKGSSCSGGTLNMSNYWVPTMVDFTAPNAQGQGTPLAFSNLTVYYKRGYLIAKPTPITAPPNGLHMITGNAKNVNAAGADHSRFLCMGPKGENPGWQTTIDAAMVAARLPNMGACAAGSDFIIEVTFPQCWDGVNLDSPNHNSHVADPLHDNVKGYYCPADHPVPLPAISFNVHYPVTATSSPDKWRLSSDAYDASLPRGLSSHGDYFFGWDPAVRDQWTAGCINASMDCHDNLLGDNTYLGN